MKITNVKISKYRAIRSCELDFSECGNLVVLAGPNGSGKTSVLEACVKAMSSNFEMPTLCSYPIRQLPYDKTTNVDLSVCANNGATIRYVAGGLKRRIFVDGKEYDDQKIYWSEAAGGKPNFFFFSSWRKPARVGGIGMSVGDHKSFNSKAEDTLLLLKRILVNLQVAAKYNAGNEHARAIKDDAFGRLNEAWRLFYPELECEFLTDVVNNPDEKTGADAWGRDLRFDLYLKKAGVSEPIPVDELSSGELEILCFLATLIIAKTPYDIVFLDEPELHLNPIWHRAVLPSLMKISPSTQFIVATHSADVWESAYEGQRFFLQDGRVVR